MAGFQFNQDFSQIAPNAGGRNYFPVSGPNGWLCIVQNTEAKENKAKSGTILEVTFLGQEPPITGLTHVMTINLSNPSQQAVEIGRGEASAIAHVTGHIRVGNSAEWHGKQLRVVIADDANDQYPSATKVLGLRDVQGNKPAQAGQGAGAAAASGFTPQQQQQPTGFVQQQPVQQGGFSQPATQGFQPAQQPVQQQTAPAGNGPGWGGPQGQPQQAFQPVQQSAQGQQMPPLQQTAQQTQAFQPQQQQQPVQQQQPDGAPSWAGPGGQ